MKRLSARRIAAFSLALMMALTSCGKTAAPSNSGSAQSGSQGGTAAVSTKDTLIVAQAQEPAMLELGNDNSTYGKRVYLHIYDPLFQVTPSGDIEGLLAESYKIDEDGMGISVTIHQGVTFHNGDPCKAEDIKYSLQYFGQSKTGPAHNWVDWDNIEVVDDYTVHIPSKYLFGGMLDTLVYITALNQRAVEELGDAYGENPVGTGPYKFVEWVAGDHITLVRNEDFWGEKPAIKTIIYRFISESSVAMMELQTGGVDVVADPSNADVYKLLSSTDPEYTVVSGGNISLNFLAFNVTDEVVANPKLREAIAYAINKDDLVTLAYDGLGDAGTVMLPSGVFGTANDLRENFPYSYDPDKAKELLAEAGYPNGLSLELLTDSSSGRGKTQEALINQLAKVGITLKVDTYDTNTVIDMQNNSLDYQMTLRRFNVNGSPTSTLNNFLKPSAGIIGGQNVAKNADDPLAADLAAAIAAYMECMDSETQKELLQTVQEEIVTYNWWIPLVEGALYMVTSNDLQGAIKVGSRDDFRACYFQ